MFSQTQTFCHKIDLDYDYTVKRLGENQVSTRNNKKMLNAVQTRSVLIKSIKDNQYLGGAILTDSAVQADRIGSETSLLKTNFWRRTNQFLGQF